MEYKFKTGFFPVRASDCGRYFENIQEEFGEIKPEHLVEEARDESNLLHGCFEWNDTVAAGKYRISQAKDLIRKLVKVEQVGGEIKTTRAVVSVSFSDEEPRSYYMASVVMEDEYARNCLLKDAYRDCEIFREKYSTLLEVKYVIEAIDKLVAKEQDIEQ
jgi:hypothetical protein